MYIMTKHTSSKLYRKKSQTTKKPRNIHTGKPYEKDIDDIFKNFNFKGGKPYTNETPNDQLPTFENVKLNIAGKEATYTVLFQKNGTSEKNNSKIGLLFRETGLWDTTLKHVFNMYDDNITILSFRHSESTNIHTLQFSENISGKITMYTMSYDGTYSILTAHIVTAAESKMSQEQLRDIITVPLFTNKQKKVMEGEINEMGHLVSFEEFIKEDSKKYPSLFPYSFMKIDWLHAYFNRCRSARSTYTVLRDQDSPIGKICKLKSSKEIIGYVDTVINDKYKVKAIDGSMLYVPVSLCEIIATPDKGNRILPDIRVKYTQNGKEKYGVIVDRYADYFKKKSTDETYTFSYKVIIKPNMNELHMTDQMFESSKKTLADINETISKNHEKIEAIIQKSNETIKRISDFEGLPPVIELLTVDQITIVSNDETKLSNDTKCFVNETNKVSDIEKDKETNKGICSSRGLYCKWDEDVCVSRSERELFCDKIITGDVFINNITMNVSDFQLYINGQLPQPDKIIIDNVFRNKAKDLYINGKQTSEDKTSEDKTSEDKTSAKSFYNRPNAEKDMIDYIY